MKQEDKELLAKDLCARLSYRVKCRGTFCKKDTRCKGGVKIYDKDFIFDGIVFSEDNVFELDSDTVIDVSSVKPYLRSMSNMTDKEKEEFDSLWNEGFGKAFDAQLNGQNDLEVKTLEITASYKSIQWLLKNHFDFTGLISKNLAIEVTKENNPYEKKMH